MEKKVITLERIKRTTIRLRTAEALRWCASCGAMTAMLAPNEAALRMQIRAREILQLIESGDIHFTETESGGLFVCTHSENHGESSV